MFAEQLSRNWWMVALRGVLAIVFGLLVFANPGITLDALLLVLAAYLIVEGISNIVTAVTHRAQAHWWLPLLEGIVSVLAGIGTFILPGLTAIVIVSYIAIWAIITGVFEVVTAIQLRKEIDNEWMLGLAGILSVLFGAALLAFPGTGVLTILWLIGGYAIVFGVLLVMLGFRLRNSGQSITTRPMGV